MDFGQLLSVAQKNSSNKQNVSYYSTKFSPPKKETKQSKALSDNIKKFLARKEEEERKKASEEKRKKENLLALRDHKAQSRINKHLKVTKSANKSVLADAINTEDTAVTITGFVQPDEDDYGYVSQEASAFYDRLLNKYSHSPDKPLFSDSGKRSVKDIASTKDRVKQALKQQEIDDSLPHRRKRKSSEIATGSGTAKDNEIEEKCQSEKAKEGDKVKKKRPPMPPPIDFASLLKLAEKKQHEPIIIEPKPKPKPETVEYERPMTKKQKKEFMKEKEWREKREREKNNDHSTSNGSSSNNINSNSSDSTSKLNKPIVNKHNSKLYNELTSTKLTNNKNVDSKNSSPKPIQSSNPSIKMKNDNNNKPSVTKMNSKPILTSEKDEILEERRKLELEKRKLESMRRMIEEEKRKLALENKNKKISQEAKSSSTNKLTKSNDKIEPSSSNIKDSKLKQINSTNNINKSRVPSTESGKPVKQFPPADCYNNKPKQFPPPDMIRRKPMKPSMNGNGKRPVTMNKRRIYDDDEDEYDSELDDFIDDDDPHAESEDYSKYISEIFGYDKRKYRNFDDDDTNMESNYAQQLKEEFVSTKIGIMEDLEDIRKEALEKKQKAMMMKKAKRKM
ncbi:protein SPT2 homolog [Chelonus insularis]|uniref:protein SPT2 homolog n=1 Tax=Chelonus insularis TaxID=460826 RepID=UPI00158AA9EE|nr:protein SPT2 homolog [Chelonus insularis]XP_034937638.1 protein SPT2 homolog [Chelonus insularis]XP_034937639.1 protein SPT2 homolog [Chelonus insularis]